VPGQLAQLGQRRRIARLAQLDGPATASFGLGLLGSTVHARSPLRLTSRGSPRHQDAPSSAEASPTEGTPPAAAY
jgi:hypothetical protein